MTGRSQTTLPLPADLPDDAAETLRVWVAEDGLHVSVNAGALDDDDMWGMMLADLVHHIATARNKLTRANPADIGQTIVDAFLDEVENPSAD